MQRSRLHPLRLLPAAIPLALAGCSASGGGCLPPCTTAIVHLAEIGRVLAIPVELNGHVVEAALDTGAMQTAFVYRTAAAVRARVFASRRSGQPLKVMIDGEAGKVAGRLLFVDELRFAGGRAAGAVLLGVPALPFRDPRLVGLVGGDVLRSWDLDLDVGHGLLDLDRPQDGAVVMAPWRDATTRVPIEPARDAGIRFPVSLDGHPLVALLDTGATRTLVAADTAAGREATSADKAEYARGVAGIFSAVRLHHYDDLQIGDLSVGPIDAVVGEHPPLGVDMIIGVDVLRLTRFYVAYDARAVLIDDGQP